MNIYTQLCGLVVITLILYFCHRQPSLGLRSEKNFRMVLAIVFFCILLDIASCFAIVYTHVIGVEIAKIIAKAYLISLVLVSYFTLVYTATDAYEKMNRHDYTLKRNLARGSLIAVLLLVIFLPIRLVYDGKILYSEGPSTIATYISVLSYILIVITLTVMQKNLIKPSRRHALIFWMSLWVLAAAVQFFFPQILIVGFASCVGMLIIFFEMENPEASISKRTGHFSSAVIREFLDYKYRAKKPFSILMISFRTIADSSDDTIILHRTIDALSEYLFTIKEATIFDTAEGYFILVFNNVNQIESTKLKINAYFQSVEDESDVSEAISLLNPFYTIVPDCNIATTSEELITVLSSFVPTEHKHFDSNEVIVNDTNIINIRQRKKIEDIVVDSITNNRVEVYFQPIYSIKKDKFTSAEALVRIRARDGRLIPPSEFIPVVEQTGRIVALSEAIFRRALSFIKTFRIERLGIEYIELNLSVRQGESPVFASRFKDLLDEYEIEPSMINLEITETYSLFSKENILANMSKLQKIGCNFSLDDFGSGSSNLNYIIDMPVQFVKLDKELTDAYMDNDRAKSIVNAVIEMAHSIGIEIIAEGIETKEALEEMKTLGVDYIQGYYFSPPVPEREFLSFIQQNNL